MQWLEVAVEAQGSSDALCALLEDLGVSGLVVEDEKDLTDFIQNSKQYWDYIDEDFLASRKGMCRVLFYLEDDEAGRSTLLQYRSALKAAGYPEAETRRVRDEDWENNWKRYYKPLEIGSRLLVVPEWEEAPAAEGRAVLRLNPGLIFGTGSHPSTRMCLEAAESLAPSAKQVLDLGCGSGILAIAALVLGAKHALGCDIDEKAPNVAMENAALNRVEDRLEVYAGDALSDGALRLKIGSSRYDLVFLNIVADVIIALSGDVPRWMAPTGTLICSGIIDGRQDEVREALLRAGLTVTGSMQTENWHAFTAKLGGNV